MQQPGRKSILIISFNPCFPLTHGGAIAQFYFIEELSGKFDITYCGFPQTMKEKNDLEELVKVLPDTKVIYPKIVLRNKKKEPLLRRLALKGYRISTKLFRSQEKCLAGFLDSLSKPLEFVDAKFIKFISEHLLINRYDYIQLEFFESLTLLNILPSESKKIFIHHEIRSKRIQLTKMGVENASVQKYMTDTVGDIENKFLKKADTVVVFNENDKSFLSDLRTEIVVSPFGIPDRLIVNKQPFGAYTRFLFLGGVNHYPNFEGLKWFLDQIFIPHLFGIRLQLTIIGQWPQSFINSYKYYEQIQFVGAVPDISVYYNSSIMLVPVLSGSGIRTKILEALANKIPVFSTTFASEGLCSKANKNSHIFHFDNAEELLEGINIMRNDAEFLIKLAEKGFMFYNQHFNKEKLLATRLSIYR